MSTRKRFGLARLLPEFPRIIRRFKKDEDGVTAVEFAILAFPFFTLIFAIIEASIYFFATQYLETAVDNVTRQYRTEQLGPATTEQEFRAVLCAEISALFDCDAIIADVRVAATFTDESLDEPIIDEDGNDNSGVQSVGRLEILQVTAIYRWPVYTNFSAPLIRGSDGIGNDALIHVTSITRTEP